MTRGRFAGEAQRRRRLSGPASAAGGRGCLAARRCLGSTRGPSPVAGSSAGALAGRGRGAHVSPVRPRIEQELPAAFARHGLPLDDAYAGRRGPPRLKPSGSPITASAVGAGDETLL